MQHISVSNVVVPEDCYVCRRPAGFNRAIVDPREEVEVGRICVNCERDELDDRFDPASSTDGTCAYCRRDGEYALPRYDPVAVETTEAVVSMVSTSLDATPIRLCEHHLYELRGGAEETAEIAVDEATLAG